MASNPQQSSLTDAARKSPSELRRPPRPPVAGKKKERKVAPPVPPPKKPAVEGSTPNGGISAVPSDTSLLLKAAPSSATKPSVSPGSRKKRQAPAPPTQAVPKPTRQPPVAVARSISTPAVLKDSKKQSPHTTRSLGKIAADAIEPAPSTSSDAPPSKPLRPARASQHNIKAQSVVVPLQPAVNDDELTYAVPRATDAPLTPPPAVAPPKVPPPPVPAHRTHGAPSNGALYESVESVPSRPAYEDVKLPSSTQALPSVFSADFGCQGEYAEPDSHIPIRPQPSPAANTSSRAHDRQTTEDIVLKVPSVKSYAKHVEDRDMYSPPPRNEPILNRRASATGLPYQPGGNDEPIYSYDPLPASSLSNRTLPNKDRKRDTSDPYDHTFIRDKETEQPIHVDLPGYDRIQHSRGSLAGLQDDQQAAAQATAAAAAAGYKMATSQPVPQSELYSEVQVPPASYAGSRTDRKSWSSVMPRQDSDTSVGPPIDPYQGTPMMDSSYLGDVPEGSAMDSTYSSIDESLPSSEYPLSYSASSASALNRRSRSLDDISETDSVFEAGQQKELEKIKGERQRRVQQHSYEYIEIKPKAKPTPTKRTLKSTTSVATTVVEKQAADKWKTEADKIRQQRLERHNYDFIEPMRPRLKSYEAPAAVSLEKEKKKVAPNRICAPIPVASFQSGQELMWDDTELEQLTSPPPAAAKPNKPVRSPTSTNTPSTPKATAESSSNKTTPTTQQQPDGLPPGWEVFSSDFGTYYFHALSGVTQWRKPSHEADENPLPDDQPLYASPTSAPYVPSIVDETVKEMTRQPSPGGSTSNGTGQSQPASQARRQLLWSSSDSTTTSGSIAPSERMQTHVYYAKCIGYVEVPESLLTQRSPGQGGCVMTCITRLQDAMQAYNDGADIPQDIHLDDTDVYLKIMGNTIKVIETHTQTVMLSQSLQGIRLWGVSSHDQYVFAFVARDHVTQRHRCRIYRCKMTAKKITRVLRASCDQLLQERKVKHDGVEKPRTEETDGPAYNTPRGAMASTSSSSDALSPMQSAPSSVAAPSSMASTTSHLDSSSTSAAAAGGASQKTFETLDPLLREDKECFAATYLGLTDCPAASGVETIQNAISKMKRTDQSSWIEVVVEVSAVKIVLVDQKTQARFKEHRVRFLTFLGMDTDVLYCAYIMSSAKDQFWCHVFMCEKTSGKLVLALQKACKARFQRVLDSQNTEEQAVKLASKYLPAVPKHQDLPPNHQRSEPPRPAPRAAGAAQQKQSAANGTAAPAAVPESTLLSMLHRLQRSKPGSSKSATGATNPYFLSAAVKYYGCEDVGSASAGEKYVQGPFERLTDTVVGKPVLSICDVDSNGLNVRDTKTKLDLMCPVDKITFCTILQNHICLIVDDHGRNMCHIIGPDRATVSLQGILSSLDAAIQEHVERMCGGRQIAVNDTDS